MCDWKKIIIKQTNSMRTAIELLNKELSRIVLVVDDNNCLIGTITDGDIRRALLRHLKMDSPVSEFMFKNPTVAKKTDSKVAIFSVMRAKGLVQIPIVDKNMTVIGIETLKNIISRERYDNPVFLMAGGFGTRLHPLTKDIPKPLLKVGKKPILETILEQFIVSGFHTFYIFTHYKSEMIREYFGDGSNWGVSIEYIQEEKPLGTAGGLGLLSNDLPELPILMMNGDILTKINFKQLLNFHIKEGGDATMCVREYDFQVPYGVIKADDCRVISIEEKPIHKFFINAGVYVLNSSILDVVDGVNYLDMPQLLEKKIENNAKVNMFPVHEYWLDIGQMDQFNKAQQDSDKIFG
jgi:dTDP-glucose pyrophosphorylase